MARRPLRSPLAQHVAAGLVIANFTGHLALLFQGYGRLASDGVLSQVILRPDQARQLGELLLGAVELGESEGSGERGVS